MEKEVSGKIVELEYNIRRVKDKGLVVIALCFYNGNFKRFSKNLQENDKSYLIDRLSVKDIDWLNKFLHEKYFSLIKDSIEIWLSIIK